MVWKCSALTKILSPILKSGAGDWRLSAETWYCSEHQRSSIGAVGEVCRGPLQIASMGRDKVTFRVDGEVQIVVLVGKEG